MDFGSLVTFVGSVPAHMTSHEISFVQKVTGKKWRERVPYENDLESDECEKATEKKERRDGNMKTIS